MSGLFITGTDTEIGKTFVSAFLIRFLAEQDLKVSGMKPIASGAKNIDGILKNEDALTLINASNVEVDYATVNPFVFEPAVSPHIAAEETGKPINLAVINERYQQLEKKSDVVIVEGVGGWYAPLSNDTTIADLAANLNLPIILVVGLRLGCLNHALLTAQAIRQTGLPIAGWIANHVDNDFSYVDKNIETLKHLLYDFPFIGNVPFVTQTTSNKDSLDQNVLNKVSNKHIIKEVLMKRLNLIK